MGRRKIDIRPITEERNRAVTFLKRKGGLFKKAHELAVLCSSDIAVIVFGPQNKVYEYSSVNGGAQSIASRYLEHVKRGNYVERRDQNNFNREGQAKNDQDEEMGDDVDDVGSNHGASPQPAASHKRGESITTTESTSPPTKRRKKSTTVKRSASPHIKENGYDAQEQEQHDRNNAQPPIPNQHAQTGYNHNEYNVYNQQQQQPPPVQQQQFQQRPYQYEAAPRVHPLAQEHRRTNSAGMHQLQHNYSNVQQQQYSITRPQSVDIPTDLHHNNGRYQQPSWPQQHQQGQQPLQPLQYVPGSQQQPPAPAPAPPQPQPQPQSQHQPASHPPQPTRQLHQPEPQTAASQRPKLKVQIPPDPEHKVPIKEENSPAASTSTSGTSAGAPPQLRSGPNSAGTVGPAGWGVTLPPPSPSYVNPQKGATGPGNPLNHRPVNASDSRPPLVNNNGEQTPMSSSVPSKYCSELLPSPSNFYGSEFIPLSAQFSATQTTFGGVQGGDTNTANGHDENSTNTSGGANRVTTHLTGDVVLPSPLTFSSGGGLTKRDNSNNNNNNNNNNESQRRT